MKNLFNKIWNKKEGFTLIELIIVIAILAIIAAIAIPNVLSAVDDSRKTTDISNAKMIADAAATVRAQNDTYAGYSGTVTLAEIVAPVDSFAEEVVDQLNNLPTPKFRGSGATGFELVVDADGTITVNVTGTGSSYELYPAPESPYVD